MEKGEKKSKKRVFKNMESFEKKKNHKWKTTDLV
jgi:hypothetical protein